ncbi:YfhO family protein [Geminocystis sp. GBBB08]|uniref:YfhO family protein n=1 Tax=Geminocystis sp. GBBB08 TaxID=2604140 RepID=UPI0027E3886E|nr:YfhO family protein [Geminocystis sp. GBBB08]
MQNLPNFLSPKTLWTIDLQGGYPLIADPQVAFWYPISYILKLFISNEGIAWNLLIISAYILASFFTYGYIYTLTKSEISAYSGGFIYGMSGFLFSHIEHTNMIQAAIWLPLSLWALEKLRHKIDKIWIVIAIISITINIFAGHPQITVYSLTLITLYGVILGINAPITTIKYYQITGQILIFGITLAFIQIIPTLELSTLSVRDEITFNFFTQYTLPPSEIIKLIFPYFFGGGDQQLYNINYFGSWTLTETTGYIGISSLILAMIGFISYRQKTIAKFWLIIVILSLLIAFGKSTPLGWLSYQLPILNKFRCLARHFLEMSLGISVLASLGIQSIENNKISQSLWLKVVGVFTGIFLLALFYINVFIKPQIIADKNLDVAKIINLQNPALIIPIIIFIATIIMIQLVLIVLNKFNFKPITVILIVLIVLDLTSFSYFWYWQKESYDYKYALIESYPFAEKYKDILNTENQRMMSLEGVLGGMENIRPNLSRKWQITNVSIYNPLLLSRYAKLFDADYASGIKTTDWAKNENQTFDIMAIRYVFMTGKKYSNLITKKDILWVENDMTLNLGKECVVDNKENLKVNYTLPQEIKTNIIAIVNHLSCSANIENNADILKITLTDSQGKTHIKTLKAGKDTAEYAYDSLGDSVKHQKAKNIFDNFPDGNLYLSFIPLNNTETIKNIEFEYLLPLGSINIKKLTFINQETNKFYPFNEIENSFSNSSRWHHVENLYETNVYENKNALPRVWLVPKIVKLTPEEITNTIKTSVLPDKSIYNPKEVALIEENVNFDRGEFDDKSNAQIIKQTATSVEIKTNSNSPSFLVLSDIYYPGWQGKIDDKKTKIFVTNYLSRGIILPEGEHIVNFEFKPFSFHLGFGISLASLFALIYLIFVTNQ